MSMIFTSLIFKQSKTQAMKGCDIHHPQLTAVKHTSQFTIAKENSTLFFTHLQFLLQQES